MRVANIATAATLAAGMLLAVPARAGTNDLLPLEHGTYVREGFDDVDPPFAAILEYDGSTFSGPHASACISKLLGHDGSTYRISTTCLANGDGTSAAPFTEREQIVVRSSTRIRFTHGGETAIYRLVKPS